jgi:2-dehydro-3-deoxyphosphogluconate aldolase/(4S)-4-hydroxy-2-oxoglutarate aldolase
VFTKLATLRTIDESGAVLIVRLPDAETAERVAHAAVEGGFRALEITLSIPGAVELIRRLATRYAPDGVAVGAGTVLDGSCRPAG